MRPIALIFIPALLAAGGLQAEPGKKAPSSRSTLKKVVRAVSTKRMRKNLFFLASDAMGGREAGSAGGHTAARYIEARYARSGLEPAGTVGFFQPWGQSKPGDPGEWTWLSVGKRRKSPSKATQASSIFRLGKGIARAKCSGAGSVEGRLVFAGYGITAPKHQYDDYNGLKVKDRIVVVLDHEPQEHDAASPFNGKAATPFSDIAFKAKNALKHGAAALLVIRDANAHDGDQAIPTDDELGDPTPKADEPSIPVAYLDAAATARVFKAARKDPKQLQRAIDADLSNASCELKSRATIRVAIGSPPGPGTKNVIALKRGVDKTLRDEFIVISAHYDHVGRGSRQTSRGGIGEIHNGADDNASGTCALLELAIALETLHLKRSVLLMSFDAEEKGLLGSKHYVSAPTIPLDKIVTILNVDMISRNKPAEIYVGGMGRNTTLDEVVRRISKRHKLFLNPEGMEKYIKRSDQWPFMERGVPGLFFFGGNHADYHKSSDTPDKSNLQKMKLFTQVVLVVLSDLANADRSPR